MRIRTDAFANGIHPDVPSYRVAIFAAAEDVVVVVALPEKPAEFLLIGIAGALLEIRDELGEVASFSYGLHQDVQMIWHDTVSMEEKIEAGATGEMSDDPSGYAVFRQERLTLVATNRHEVCSRATVFGQRQTDWFPR